MVLLVNYRKAAKAAKPTTTLNLSPPIANTNSENEAISSAVVKNYCSNIDYDSYYVAEFSGEAFK
jgi:hypothetical protein